MYYINVINADGKKIKVEVTEEIYKVFEDSRSRAEKERKECRFHRIDGDVDLCSGPTLEDIVAIREKMKAIHTVLETCTPLQHERFLLYFLYGFGYKEIGEITGCNTAAAHKTVQHVLKRIKKFLE